MQSKVKRETGSGEVRPRKGSGRSKSDQAPAGGTAKDMLDAALIAFPSGVQQSHGGTTRLSFKRGSLVKHPRHGLCTVGGRMDARVNGAKRKNFEVAGCCSGRRSGRDASPFAAGGKSRPARPEILPGLRDAAGKGLPSLPDRVDPALLGFALLILAPLGARVSFHHLDNKRLCQNAKPKDIRVLKRISLLFQPVTKDKPSTPA